MTPNQYRIWRLKNLTIEEAAVLGIVFGVVGIIIFSALSKLGIF